MKLNVLKHQIKAKIRAQNNLKRTRSSRARHGGPVGLAGAAVAIVARLRGVPDTPARALRPGLLSTSTPRPCYIGCL